MRDGRTAVRALRSVRRMPVSPSDRRSSPWLLGGRALVRPAEEVDGTLEQALGLLSV